MDTLIINKTKSTPQIIIDCDKGIVELEGSCMPEDSVDFFKPVYDKVDCFQNLSIKKLTVTLNVDYVNSGALKAFIDLFTKFKDLGLKEIDITWMVEADDEELIDTIEDIHRISDLDFHLKYI